MPATARQLQEDKRRFPRRSVLWGAKLYSSGHLYDCSVWNISLGGAKVHLPAGLKKGTPVTLCTERFGEIQAEIVWTSDKAVGLHFILPENKVEDVLGQTVVKLGLKGARS